MHSSSVFPIVSNFSVSKKKNGKEEKKIESDLLAPPCQTIRYIRDSWIIKRAPGGWQPCQPSNHPIPRVSPSPSPECRTRQWSSRKHCRSKELPRVHLILIASSLVLFHATLWILSREVNSPRFFQAIAFCKSSSPYETKSLIFALVTYCLIK